MFFLKIGFQLYFLFFIKKILREYLYGIKKFDFTSKYKISVFFNFFWCATVVVLPQKPIKFEMSQNE
jgi:hypothetical protein